GTGHQQVQHQAGRAETTQRQGAETPADHRLQQRWLQELLPGCQWPQLRGLALVTGDPEKTAEDLPGRGLRRGVRTAGDTARSILTYSVAPSLGGHCPSFPCPTPPKARTTQ